MNEKIAKIYIIDNTDYLFFNLFETFVKWISTHSIKIKDNLLRIN